jgi:hypothetical protein
MDGVKFRFYCHAFSERILRHHALCGLMKPKASRGVFTLYYKYHLPPSLDGGQCNTTHFSALATFSRIVAKAAYFFSQISLSKDGGN